MRFFVHKSPLLYAVMFCCSAGFLQFLVSSGYQSFVHEHPTISAIPLLLVLLVVLGCEFIWSVYCVVTSRCSIEVSERGIADCLSTFELGLVPWSDILYLRVEEGKLDGQLCMVVEPRALRERGIDSLEEVFVRGLSVSTQKAAAIRTLFRKSELSLSQPQAGTRVAEAEDERVVGRSSS
jgi:hypothetical protein